MNETKALVCAYQGDRDLSGLKDLSPHVRIYGANVLKQLVIGHSSHMFYVRIWVFQPKGAKCYGKA